MVRLFSSHPPVTTPPPSHPSPGRAIARQLLAQAWPVLVAQLLSVAMMISDTLIAGRYGTLDLAGVAVGSSFYVSIVMLLSGVLQAVAPTVAHHVGAGHTREIGPTLRQGFWLALMLSVPGVLVLAWPAPLLALADVPPEVAAKATAYMQATAWGLPAMLLYRTFYAFTNAVGHPRVLMGISALMVAAHLPLAWSLANGRLGWLGLPALGGPGCGLSTAVMAWLALACGLLHLARSPDYRPYAVLRHWAPPQARPLGRLLRLGLPMGLSGFIEITSFTLIAVFASRLGAETVAGHRIVANFTGLIYMMPLSLSIATLVLVGQAHGARDWARARTTVRVGLRLACAQALLTGALLWLLREPLLALWTRDPAVRAVSLGLVAYLCIYQLFDGIQTVLGHALRGLKITLLPMLLHSLCFWGVGLAGGYWLSFHAGGRALRPSVAGFWEACVLATLLACLLLGPLLRQAFRARHA